MQLEKVEAWDLLRLMHRAGAFQDDPRLTFEYDHRLADLILDGRPTHYEWAFLRAARARSETPICCCGETLMTSSWMPGYVNLRLWFEKDMKPKAGDRRRIAGVLFGGRHRLRAMLRQTRSLLEIYGEFRELTRNLARRVVQPLPRLVFTESEKVGLRKLE